MRIILGAILALMMGLSIGQANTLLYNIDGYTMENGELKRFGAVEYDNGKVVRTFSGREPTFRADEMIDGGGRTVLPGLIDAHGHISWHGRALSSVDLIGSSSEAEAASRVAQFAARPNSTGWLWGRGWNQEHWESKEFPTRHSIDAVGNDLAIVLNRIDGHAIWVSSKTLELAGIDRNMPDPEGGQILRDENGDPTGVLVDTAMALVFDIMPENDHNVLQQEIVIALNDLASVGLTSAHDAGIKSDEVRAMIALREKEELPVRVYAMLDVLDPKNDEYLHQGILTDEKAMMEIRSVKILADGAMGSNGAAMIEEYHDRPGHRGMLLMTEEELEHHMSRAMAHGFQVNVHAIGDLANRVVLNHYEKMQSDSLRRKQRHRIEHSQIIHPVDLERFMGLGVIASIQPTHATSDKDMVESRIGAERLEKGAYAWKSLLASGAHIAGGSDFPVEPINPFYGLHAAVTRQDRDNQPLDGWMPHEKLSRTEALALFTTGSAYAAHQENEIGQISPGYWADFIILEEPYFEVPEEDIWKIKVHKTFVAGNEVYSAE